MGTICGDFIGLRDITGLEDQMQNNIEPGVFQDIQSLVGRLILGVPENQTSQVRLTGGKRVPNVQYSGQNRG